MIGRVVQLVVAGEFVRGDLEGRRRRRGRQYLLGILSVPSSTQWYCTFVGWQVHRSRYRRPVIWASLGPYSTPRWRPSSRAHALVEALSCPALPPYCRNIYLTAQVIQYRHKIALH